MSIRLPTDGIKNERLWSVTSEPLVLKPLPASSKGKEMLVKKWKEVILFRLLADVSQDATVHIEHVAVYSV